MQMHTGPDDNLTKILNALKKLLDEHIENTHKP